MKEDVTREFLWSLKLKIFLTSYKLIKLVCSGLALNTKAACYIQFQKTLDRFFSVCPYATEQLLKNLVFGFFA